MMHKEIKETKNKIINLISLLVKSNVDIKLKSGLVECQGEFFKKIDEFEKVIHEEEKIQFNNYIYKDIKGEKNG